MQNVESSSMGTQFATIESLRIGFQLGLLALASTVLADDSGDLLEKIRRHMWENLGRLPNYTCRETIERTAAEAGSRHFQLVDRLRLEVAFVGGRELYAWPGAERFEERSLPEIVGGGAAIGTGSFGMHARAVFTTSAPKFRRVSEEQRDGRQVVRFDYQIAQDRSHYAVQTAAEPVVVGYEGFFEADTGTLDPLRLNVQAKDLPVELKLRRTSETVQYGRMTIGDSDFLLPVSSELSIVEMTGREGRNLTRFEGCRQYAGESTVHFDVEDSVLAGGQASAPIVLPPHLQLEAALRDGIDEDKVARGDPVYVIVRSDLKKSGRVIVPKGAVLTGRITRVRSYSVRTLMYLLIGMRFHTIAFDGRRGPFTGEVEAAGVGTDYAVAMDHETGDSLISIKTKTTRIAAGTRLLIGTR